MKTTNPTPPDTRKKLPRLPPNLRVHKRPLNHQPIPSPYAASSASNPKAIYISHHTPFVSALKRTRKLLSEIDKRSLGKVNLVDSNASDRERLRATARNRSNNEKGKEKAEEEVLLKATGKAIERVLGLAVFLQGEADLRVTVRTGTVGVVDDVVAREGRGGGVGKAGGGEGGGEEHGEGQEIPESWVRKASMVEVVVSLR